MSTDKGRMLARTGWQGWDCECCGEPATKGQNRAREKRERLRSLQDELPKRDRKQDLSWMEEEYAAARPSIIRAMGLEDGMIFNAYHIATHQGDPEE